MLLTRLKQASFYCIIRNILQLTLKSIKVFTRVYHICKHPYTNLLTNLYYLHSSNNYSHLPATIYYLCNLSSVSLPCLCSFSVVSLKFLCRFSAVLCRLSAISLLSLCHLSAVSLLSFCCLSAFSLLSTWGLSAVSLLSLPSLPSLQSLGSLPSISCHFARRDLTVCKPHVYQSFSFPVTFVLLLVFHNTRSYQYPSFPYLVFPDSFLPYLSLPREIN